MEVKFFYKIYLYICKVITTFVALNFTIYNLNFTCMTGKSSFLLPHKFQKVGWWGLLVSAVLFIILLWLDAFARVAYAPPVYLVWIPFLVSILFIAVSQEKIDDEYIKDLRSKTVCCIVYAFVVVRIIYHISDYICLSLGALATFGIISFVDIVFNPMTLIVIYIITFRILLIVNARKMKEYVEK